MEQPTLTVYYDSACYVCAAEIDVYRKKDKHRKLAYVDISAPAFDAHQEGLDPKTVHKWFHARRADGELLVGVDAFIAIWDQLSSFRFMAKAARNPVARFLMDQGYKIFVEVRPYLPRKKCADGSCNL